MTKTPWISFSWNEGRVWDHWMYVHFLSGTIIACCVTLLSMQTLHAYLVGLGLLVAWEVGEKIGRVKEHAENLALDVVVGMIGFFLFQTCILPELDRSEVWWALLILSLLCLIGGLLGWMAFRKRGA